VEAKPMRAFDGYSSHNAWGTDHFGFTFRGDLLAFCAELKAKGVRMAVEPWEFKPGVVLCYVATPDGVSIDLIQVGGSWSSAACRERLPAPADGSNSIRQTDISREERCGPAFVGSKNIVRVFHSFLPGTPILLP